MIVLIVATTTNIHKETGMNNLITCWAPYLRPSSSSPVSPVGGLFGLLSGTLCEVPGTEPVALAEVD